MRNNLAGIASQVTTLVVVHDKAQAAERSDHHAASGIKEMDQYTYFNNEGEPMVKIHWKGRHELIDPTHDKNILDNT